ncbi:MAG: 4'-phosphopantetheinyl transferase superfamily protein, partial [Caulobacter sp.]
MAQRTSARPMASTADHPPKVDFVVEQQLDLTTAPYVADHELYPQRAGWPVAADRHPIIPLTMEIELVRLALEAKVAGWKVIEVSAVSAYRWLPVAQPRQITLRFASGPDGVVDAQIEGFFRAQLTLARAYPHAPQASAPALHDRQPARIDAARLYGEGWMFHGPAYQGIVALDGVGADGVDVSIRTPTGLGGLVDNMGQAAAYWFQEQESGSLAMPIGLDRLRLFSDAPLAGSLFTCRSRIRSVDDNDGIFDIWLDDAHGRSQILVEGWRTRRYPFSREALKRLRQPHLLGVSQILEDGVALFEDVYDTAVARDMLARVYLSAPELAQYDALPPRRRRQWLNGRCAAKDAVLNWLRGSGRGGVYPKELRIENDASGCPRIAANVTDAAPVHLHLSITHKGKLAAAMVGEAPVGVDVEAIEPRDEGFAALVASPSELALASDGDVDAAVTRAWVAKEVAAKAAQTGLGGDAKAWTIQSRAGSALTVNGHQVRTRRLEGYVLGWSAPGAAPPTGPKAARGDHADQNTHA